MLGDVDDLMPIGEFSDRSGLSPKRLRNYAAGELLVPAAVDAATGYRYYSSTQLRAARLIDAFREAGVPLADIAALLADPSGADLDAWAGRLETESARRRVALARARRLLGAALGSPERHELRRTGRESTMRMHTAGRTDIGRVRKTNQDAIVGRDDLALVADGMGAPPGGEIAAELAVSLVQAAFTGASLDELRAAVRAANRAIWDRAGVGPDLEGMGTTICGVGLTADELAIVHVGDSRAYLFRGGELTRLTEDHSVTAELVRRGEVTEEEAREHPHHGVLTRALGVAPDVDLDASVQPVAPGDRVLVGSDGLFNEVTDDELASFLTAADGLQSTADALVDHAVSHGGADNVSVVIAAISA